MTLRERCFAVAGPGGARIGAVIRNGAGAFVAWGPGRIGEYPSMDEAEQAVRAVFVKKAGR